MEQDIVVVTSHIEIHPDADRNTGNPTGRWSVVRDGRVHSTHGTLAAANETADELAREITANSTDRELIEAYETHRRNGNGEAAGLETDTPAEAASREGWTLVREIATHGNPSKAHAVAQDAAGGLWVIMDLDGPWAIRVAE